MIVKDGRQKDPFCLIPPHIGYHLQIHLVGLLGLRSIPLHYRQREVEGGIADHIPLHPQSLQVLDIEFHVPASMGIAEDGAPLRVALCRGGHKVQGFVSRDPPLHIIRGRDLAHAQKLVCLLIIDPLVQGLLGSGGPFLPAYPAVTVLALEPGFLRPGPLAQLEDDLHIGPAEGEHGEDFIQGGGPGRGHVEETGLKKLSHLQIVRAAASRYGKPGSRLAYLPEGKEHPANDGIAIGHLLVNLCSLCSL